MYADRINTPSPEPVKKHTRYTSIRKSVPPPPSNRSHHYHHHHHHQQHNKNRHHHNQHKEHKDESSSKLQYAPREGSLSTIAEESGSYHSASPVHLEKNKSQVSVFNNNAF